MANSYLGRGGTPDINPMNCTGTSYFNPPYEACPIIGSDYLPPQTGFVDERLEFGYATDSYPLKPNAPEMIYQKKDLLKDMPGVDDFIGMVVMPPRYYTSSMNVLIGNADPKMKGAIVSLAAQRVRYNMATGDEQYIDATEFDALLPAAAKNIDLSIPGDYPVFLAHPPLYSKPTIYDFNQITGRFVTTPSECYFFGIRIVSMPTDTSVKISDMRNDLYLTVKTEGLIALPSR